MPSKKLSQSSRNLLKARWSKLTPQERKDWVHRVLISQRWLNKTKEERLNQSRLMIEAKKKKYGWRYFKKTQ